MRGMIKVCMMTVAILALSACSTGKQKPSGIVDGNGGTTSQGISSVSGIDSENMGSVGDEKNTIYFDLDKYNVKPEYQHVVDAYAAYLTEHADARLQVNGYTDDSGSREWNLALSELRAKSVRKALEEKGVVASRVDVVGYGQEYSLPVCQGIKYCWQNRRAIVHTLD